MCVALELMA